MTAYAEAGDLDMHSYLTNGPRMNSAEAAASLRMKKSERSPRTEV